MTTKELLVAARELISNKENWTRHVYARNQFDADTSFEYPEATKFCAMGAVKRLAYKLNDLESICNAENQLNNTLRNHSDITEAYITTFNDSHDHPEVLAIFDETIQRLLD